MRKTSRRIGLFGGTFNPIHSGHLRAGVEIRQAFDLDQVLFIPSSIPPHKEKKNLVPFDHRLKMVRLAIQNRPCFKASDVERKFTGKSYSIQTLKHYHQAYGPEAQLFFILGIDAFLEINTWREFGKLFHFSHFVVMGRPGYRRRSIREFLTREISPDFVFFPRENRFLHPGGHSVHFFPVTLLDISSTQIRSLRRNQQPISFLLPEAVEAYILKRKFYET